MNLSDLKLLINHKPGNDYKLSEELHQLDAETFEVEDLADVGLEAASCTCSSSCSTSSCCSCSTSSCCSCSTSCTS